MCKKQFVGLCLCFNQEFLVSTLVFKPKVNCELQRYFLAHVAAANNAVRCMELLLPKLGNVNITDRLGRTCLHLAAYFGHYEMVELLLVSGGVSVNQVSCRF